MPLETYADLTAPAKTNPAVTVAALSLTRMQWTSAPMPPRGNTPPTSHP
jgi:glycerol uptake facilitator-like aquaporin